jgi:hypothetical protein
MYIVFFSTVYICYFHWRWRKTYCFRMKFVIFCKLRKWHKNITFYVRKLYVLNEMWNVKFEMIMLNCDKEKNIMMNFRERNFFLVEISSNFTKAICKMISRIVILISKSVFLISKNYFFDQQVLFFWAAELICWSAKI